MGTILASTIVSKASIQLLDTSNVRWSQAELLGWLNSAQRQIAQAIPSTNNAVVSLLLAAGARQTIPSDGFQFINLYRNMGADGVTAGRPVRATSHAVLDAFDLDWTTSTASAVSQCYMSDPDNNYAFYVYPPSTGTGYVEVNYAQSPPDITLSTAITLPDVFESSILFYILALAYGKDSEAANVQTSANYFSMFVASMNAASPSAETSAPK